MLYPSYSTIYMEVRAQYSTARDNGDTQENKAGEMQSKINQLKHGKERAVRDNSTRGVVSIDPSAPPVPPPMLN